MKTILFSQKTEKSLKQIKIKKTTNGKSIKSTFLINISNLNPKAYFFIKAQELLHSKMYLTLIKFTKTGALLYLKKMKIQKSLSTIIKKTSSTKSKSDTFSLLTIFYNFLIKHI
jgi:hypothetical protein